MSVATARLVHAPLVTADERLLRAVGDKERLLLPLSTVVGDRAEDEGKVGEGSAG